MSTTVESTSVQRPAPAGHAWPLTPYQRDVMTVAVLFPGLPLAQLAGYVRVAAPLDIGRLQECMHVIAARHDSLRIRIDSRAMTQSVAPALADIEVVDVTGEPEPRAAAKAWMDRATNEVLPPDGQLVRPAIVIDDIDSFVIYLSAHHAVADGWALTFGLHQLCEMYLGTEAAAPPLSASFLDVITADAEYRESEVYRHDRDCLVEQFADVSPALFTRNAAIHEHTRSRRSLRFERDTWNRLRATGHSVFAVTTTAVAWYLRRIHRDGDVVIGVPLLNRRPEDLFTIGHLTNMLPLLVGIDESRTFAENLARTTTAVSELKTHQRFPLGDLQTALRERGAGSGNLFDVTYSYISVPGGGLPEGVTELAALASGYSLDALNITVREYKHEGVLEIDMFCADDVFDADYPIDDLTRHVFGLLDAALANPDTPLAELEMLSADDHERLRSFEGPVPGPLDQLATIDRLVTAQISRTPNAPALSWLEADDTIATLTYGEFGTRVEALATQLRRRELHREEPVALLLRRSPDLVIAIHAVLAAGGAYVPIDPDFPAARVRTILSDCAARFLIATDEFEGIADELGIDRVTPAAAQAVSALERRTGPNDLAYIIYTSGSTGTPKGVMIEHLSVVNRISWMQRAYPLTADDVILQKTPATFDVSVWELMWWSLTGAQVALLAPGGERDPRKIAAAIERHRVSVIHFVPSMLGPFLDHVTEHGVRADQLASLRLVFCSGEALTPALVRRFRKVFADLGLAHVRLINLYGPTEATVDVSSAEITEDGPRVPIGRPIDNIALLVLDAQGRRCPLGVPGELNIAGVGVGRGYRGRDDLTAAAFVVDDRVPGARRYRTGDLARWLADGTLEYLGRFDDQVKVRGNRVTLGEIDNALADCPGVSAGVVIDARIAGETTTLVAYYVGAVPVSAVADHLADRLPGYMVPAHFVQLDEIPLTRSGKVDRKALPTPTRRRKEFQAPRTDSERAIAAVWAETLGVDVAQLDVHDDFFTIGGDSILALRLRTAAEHHGLRFDIDRFFASPTIADLATAVDDDNAAPQSHVSMALELIPLIDRATLTGVEDAFPATALQLGMLFHSLERTESTLYKDVFRYRLRMTWQENAFREAYRRLVRRQPALRSDFDLTGRSVPIQIVHHEVPDTLCVGPENALDFDDYVLDAAPLYRMHVVPESDGFELVLRFHHAILDGWSVANLIRELLQDYLHLLGHDIESVDPTPFSAALLAEYVRDERAAEADPQARQYWSQLLEGFTSTRIASTRAYEPPSDEPTESTATLPRWLRRAVAAFATTHRVPVKSVLLTAHCLTLRAMTGAEDVTTGVVSHARPAREGGDVVAGLFLNTLPTRLDSTPENWLAAVRQLAQQERDSHPHRRYPLRAIIADHGGAPFDTAFNYVNYHVFSGLTGDEAIALTGFRIREETNFALLVTAAIDPRTDDLTLRIGAGPDALSRAQCEQYARLFIGTLEAMVREPHGPVDPAAAHTDDAVHLVEAAAALHPDAVAVADDSTTWDYRTLDRAAEAVALRLRAEGLPSGARVAVHLERSPELIAVVLGVLRAGAAVVPLDPTYPQARREAMIARSQPFRIVTDAAELLGAPAPDAVLPAIHPESIAYVLFTSGSTGEPKGVAMPHRGLANLVRWQNRSATAALGATTLQFAPLSFDVSFQEIFATLAGGGTLRLISEQQRRDPVTLVRAVAEHDVARVYLPYVALQAFAEAARTSGVYPTSLVALASSGEQLRITPEIRALADANPGVVVENQYGPTESHVAATYSMSGGADRFPDLPPVGTGVGGTIVELLDARLRPVSPGVAGEIYLGGDGLAQGYERQPDLTALRFVAAPGGRIRYRTGDLGMTLPGGDLVCLGRTDTQVKVRGYRVECAEVELALSAVAGVAHAAVIARRLDGIDSVLEAFLVTEPGVDDAITDRVRGELRRVLPAHMMPARFHWVDALPLTPSGKRDDVALHRLAKASVTTATGRPPTDEYEREIAEILAEFAGSGEFGADTDFFAAGGTSIGAMRVAMTVAKRFGVEIPLEAFVAAPTTAGLATIVRAGGVRRTFDPLVPLRKSDSGQTPLFLIHPIGGNVICYVPLVRHLPGDRPVYGLQAAGAEPGTSPLNSVPELAASYIEAIRRVHPHGPYHIAGWSFGGYVALEVARQLPEAEVEQLLLLDTMALGDKPGGRITERDLIVWFFGELIFYARGNDAAGIDVDTFDTSATDRDELFDSILRQSIDNGILPKDSSPQLIRRLYAVFEANFEATVNYRMTPVDREITLLRARDGLPASIESAHRLAGTMFGSTSNGWDRWAPRGLDIREIPGDHLSIMTEPHIAHVAGLLGELLEREPVRHSNTGTC